MGLIGNLLNFLIIIIPPIIIAVLYTRKKRVILEREPTTLIEKANQNQSLKDWKVHYTDALTKFILPALIMSSLLTVGDSFMSNIKKNNDKDTDQKIVELHTNLSYLKEDHENRIKHIEDFLFSPGGPSTPTIFSRLDDLENSRKDIEKLLLRMTDPNPMLRGKIIELENQIILLRQEITKLREEIDDRIEKPRPRTRTMRR